MILHKWSMLDDRRRRVIVGLVIIGVILIGLAIYATSSSSAAPDDHPNTTESPSTPAPVTDKPKPEPEPDPKYVSSTDKLALAKLRSKLVYGHELVIALNSDLEGLEVQSTTDPTIYEVKFVSFGKQYELSGRFQVDPDKGSGAEELMLSYRDAQKNQQVTCKLIPFAKGVQFFQAPKGKHYKCPKSVTYSCVEVKDSKSTDIMATLIIEDAEFELARKQPADERSPQFETPAQMCD